jgi:hypothetical protein
MRKLSDLISDIKAEINELPYQDAAALSILGHEIKEEVQNLIGTHQIFWKDLKQSTIKRKKSHNGGKGGDASSPLWDDGTFHDSIEYELVERNAVQIFSEAKNALYTEYGNAYMPPRPVFKPAAMIVLKKLLKNNRLQKFYLKRLK